MRWGRTAQQAALTAVHVPAPTGGINTSEPGGAMPATDAVLANNLVANEFGLRSRLGYAEWVTGMVDPVRSVISFAGSTGANSKLWAVTAAGIFDATSSADAPAADLALADNTGEAGFGVSTTVVTGAGHFCFYADEVNGLYRYVESTATWTKLTVEITGVDPADICFVMVWKNRLWMVERDTGTAWYLTAGAVAGVATAFYFGNKFRAGGHLVGLYNWTADGGTGIDDFLVAVSSGGDVVVYQGTDPDSAIDFSLRGDWFVGSLPAGRRVATDFGGELLLLTQVGILPMSKLLSGQAVNPAVYSTRKIAGQFARLMAERGSLNGWSLRISPKEQALIVTVPDVDGAFTAQFAQSLNTGGWSTFSGVPMLCNEVWDGNLYAGGPGGTLYKITGSLDNVARNGDTAAATAVESSGLTSFQSMGSAKRKQAMTIRPHFRAEGASPDYGVEVRYDFDVSELSTPTVSTPPAGGVWDTGAWDTATWSAGGFFPYGEVRGATGIGNALAIGYRFKSVVQTTLVGFDIAVRECGIY